MPSTTWQYYIVYETTNLVNGRKYIGCHKTNNLDDGYLGSGTLLKRAIKKHGKCNFSRKDLFIFSNEQEMFEKERELVTERVLDDVNYYNVNSGGNGGFSHIHRNMDKYRHLFSKKSDDWVHWSKKDPERHSKVAAANAAQAAETVRKRMGEDAYKAMMRERSLKQKGLPKKAAKGAKGAKWVTDGRNRKKVPKYYVLEEGWRYGLDKPFRPATADKIKKNCLYCGAEMILYPSHAKTRECCSISCSKKLMHKRRAAHV